MKTYEINNWPGYFLVIDNNIIKVFSSWGRGVPKKLKKQSPAYEISQRVGRNGYVRVDLNIGKNGRKQVFLHRLIAETLIPNPDNLECVDHIDGNKLNNHPSNLQWITRGDNVKKAQLMGRWGTPPKKYKLFHKDGKIQIIENVSKFARENDYAATKIVAVCKKRRKSHKDIIKVIEL
jgi:hypothetical protein